MGRNPDRNAAAKTQRRNAILSAALALFSKKGLGATKVGDIAKEIGMSQGLLYRYFPSKEAIYVEIIRSAFARLNDACRHLEAGPLSPEAKITAALEALVGGLERDPDAAKYHVLIAEANLTEAVPDEAREIIAAESAFPYQVIARILAAGQERGAIRPGDPAELSTLFWTTIKGLALHSAVWGTAHSFPKVETLLPLFLKQ